MGCLFFYCEFLAFYIKTSFRAPSQTFFQTQQNKREKAGQVSLPRSPSSFLPTAVRFHTALPVPWPRHQPPPSTAGGKADLMAGTGRDPLQGPSREEAPPARPRSPLNSRLARAAGPGCRGNRTPIAGGRGAHRYRLRRAPLGPVSAKEREQGRGFFAHAQQRSHVASRGPAWLAAMGVECPEWEETRLLHGATQKLHRVPGCIVLMLLVLLLVLVL